MTAKVVSTEEFWKVLCDPRAIRVDGCTAMMCGTTYVTLESPERAIGFLADKLAGTQAALGLLP